MVGFPGGPAVKDPPANAGDMGSIPGLEDPLEKEMATHSSILAWEIPWTEEPVGLQSVHCFSCVQLFVTPPLTPYLKMRGSLQSSTHATRQVISCDYCY